MPFRFFDLPQELRDRIYAEMTCTEHGQRGIKAINFQLELWPLHELEVQDCRMPVARLVSHRFRKEYDDAMIPTKPKLVFINRGLQGRYILGDAAQPQIKRIEIHAVLSDLPHDDRACYMLARQLPDRKEYFRRDLQLLPECREVRVKFYLPSLDAESKRWHVAALNDSRLEQLLSEHASTAPSTVDIYHIDNCAAELEHKKAAPHATACGYREQCQSVRLCQDPRTAAGKQLIWSFDHGRPWRKVCSGG